jgi:hypothetical protein
VISGTNGVIQRSDSHGNDRARQETKVTNGGCKGADRPLSCECKLMVNTQNGGEVMKKNTVHVMPEQFFSNVECKKKRSSTRKLTQRENETGSY